MKKNDSLFIALLSCNFTALVCLVLWRDIRAECKEGCMKWGVCGAEQVSEIQMK